MTESLKLKTRTRIWNEYHSSDWYRIPPAEEPRDLIDFCSDFGKVELSITQFARLLDDAAECDAARVPTLRAHRDDLRHIQAALAVLVAEAEAA
jgi:hypothetical protein